MGKKIRYVRFNPHHNAELFPQLIKCYREVFSEEPWNEWKQCKICKTKWGLNEKPLLQKINFRHCGQPIVDFWPEEVVQKDLLHEITPNASCWLALNNKTVIGFCWGYPISPKNLEKKLKLQGLTEYIYNNFGNTGRIAYHDDLGVLKQYRGMGIAKEMFIRSLQDFSNQRLQIGVGRTKTNPPAVTYLWFVKIGYKVIAEYNDADGRVILARSLTNLYL